MKCNKKELLLTTLLCFLPILVGAGLYNRLPETIATHFTLNGQADGWSSRAFAVFGIPAVLAGINLFLQFSLNADPKKQNMSAALHTLAVWLVPLLSIFLSAVILGNALGYAIQIETLAPLLLGLLFIVIGNYLPKTKQSYTMGIRLPWTLASEENWNLTHRMTGFLWVLGGLIAILLTILHLWKTWILFSLLLVLMAVPTLYSYLLFKKGI